MARYIVWNGVTQIHPGALSRVNIDALAQVGSSINGIIGLIGEADGWQPDVIATFDDNTTAKSVFRSGDLANAIRACFEPANDPRVPAGAFRVRTYKTNPSTQSTWVLQTAAAVSQCTLTTEDYGAHTAQTQIQFEQDLVDTDRVMLTQIDPDGNSEVITDVGDRPLLDVVYKGPEEPVSLSTDTITAPAASAPNGDVINWAGADANDIGKHVICTGSGGGAGVAALGCIRRITAAAPGASITVDTDFTDDATGAAVADTGGISQVYQVVTKIISPIAADSVAATTVRFEDDPSQTVPTGARTFGIGGNHVDYRLWVRVMSGPGQGQIRQATGSALAGTQLTLTVNTFDTSNLPTTASTFGIIMVTSAIGAVTGASGAASLLAAPIVTPVAFGVALAGEAENPPANLSQTLSAAIDVNTLCATINAIQIYVSQPDAGSVWEATVGAGRDGTLATSRLDWDISNTAVALTHDVRVTQNLLTNKNHRFLDNLSLVVDAYNNQSEVVTAAKRTGALEGSGLPRYYNVATYPTAAGVRGNTTNTDFQDGFDAFLNERVNIIVPLISSDFAAPGTAEVLTVHQQCLTHVNTAAGVGKSERNAYCSTHRTGASAVADVTSDIAALNNVNISMAIQQPTILDVDGNLAVLDEWAMGCLFAGIQAGTPIGEPPTFKYIRASAVTEDSNLDPTDRTISNSLQLAGAMFTEPGPAAGFRIVRALTTYLTDDNVARTDVNVREVINYISYELRTAVENKFTGLKGTPARVADVKDFVAAWLEVARTDEIIVDSTDTTTGATIHAWRTLRVTLSGDTLTIVFEVYPVLGINYETIEAFAQLPVISV